MRILITGGTGFLGQHLARTLQAQGHDISLLGRNFSGVQSLLAAGARPVVADLRDASAVREACMRCEAVYHAGALSAAWGRREDFFAINVGGTEAVVAGCLEADVRRLIYVSSPSVVFDGKDQCEATEAMAYPRRFASVYSLTKKLGEDRVRSASSDLETVILRPKAIFGPGDRSLLPQLVAAARRRRLPQVGSGTNLVDLTYVENVGDALVLALEAEAAVGKIYTITNGEHANLWATIREVLLRLGLPTNLRRVSLPAALALATIMEARASLTGQAPLLTRYSAAILGRTQTYDISAARRDLGYVPRIPLAAGIERTLESLREVSL
ncbi:MAG: NAD-dependent epimerase/dehydratase family protein [Ktedonobacteraceae bacterium]|nr:NAD-dependent epimerase/dehydratase family protein [Ktedonobacteraceae bacterium]